MIRSTKPIQRDQHDRKTQDAEIDAGMPYVFPQ